jgi:hypothetical protein
MPRGKACSQEFVENPIPTQASDHRVAVIGFTVPRLAIRRNRAAEVAAPT